MTQRNARQCGPVGSRPVTVGLGAAVALVGALSLTGALTGNSDDRAAARPPTTATSRPAMPEEPPSTLDTADQAPPSALSALPTTSSTPRLHVPALGIDAPIVPVPLEEGGVLDPPQSVSDVGWWDASAEAGARDGQTVLTGHTVHSGGGVMDDLEELRDGDVVRVTDEDGHVDYAVTEVATWTKAELSANAVAAFGQDRGRGRLVMVTCEDWDGGDFDSNVVVFAERLEPRTSAPTPSA